MPQPKRRNPMRLALLAVLAESQNTPSKNEGLKYDKLVR
jgi:hypothetical protein